MPVKRRELFRTEDGPAILDLRWFVPLSPTTDLIQG